MAEDLDNEEIVADPSATKSKLQAALRSRAGLSPAEPGRALTSLEVLGNEWGHLRPLWALISRGQGYEMVDSAIINDCPLPHP